MPTLHWIGKEAVVKHHKDVPYRLLEPVAALSCTPSPFKGEGENAPSLDANASTNKYQNTENLIVQGDNLHALKALLPRYAGQVKCIYIDPPYNTGNEGWVYNDNVNSPEIKRWLGEVVGKEGETLDRHDRWLCMMYPRLLLLKQFLREDGAIFVSIDDNEVASLRLLMDEIFGAGNFLNMISAKMKQTSGASGGGEDKKLKKNIEYIIVYSKNENCFESFNEVYDEEPLMEHIDQMRNSGKSWKYTRVLISQGKKEFLSQIVDGSGLPIKIFKHNNAVIKTIKELMEVERLSEEECYLKYYSKVFRDTNAQSSIRTRVMEEVAGKGDFFSADYVPRSGRNKGNMVTVYYKGNNCDLFAWLKDIVVKKGASLVKLEKTSTYWEGFPLNNLTKEGGIQLPNGKKPELLIEKILNLSTDEGDLVLDSFAGSGTTAAVANKLKRRWITIEIGEHAVSHVFERLKKVVEGSDTGGITAKLNWTGGGGFQFCKLSAEPLFTAQGQIRSDVTFAQLAEFVWFVETGTGFSPSPQPSPIKGEGAMLTSAAWASGGTQASPIKGESAMLPSPRVGEGLGERGWTSPLLGIHQGRAIYLLYNGILKDKSVGGGNVLTQKVLDILPKYDGAKVIFAAANRLGAPKLAREQIVFKQTPYALDV